MFSGHRSLLVSALVLGLPFAALAQPKADAGSGPTNGATSTNDAGSGPTEGAKANVGSADLTGVTTGQNSQKPDDAKAAGTGGGNGAESGNMAPNRNEGSAHVGATGAATTPPPGSAAAPSSADTAGTGGGQGAKAKPEKTP